MIKLMFLAILFITISVIAVVAISAILFSRDKTYVFLSKFEAYFMKYAIVASIISALFVAGFVLVEVLSLSDE